MSEQMLLLSPSKINLMNDCERCFWEEYANNNPKPRGIFPTIPGGIDRVAKHSFDDYRGTLPPYIEGLVKGNLMEDTDLLNKWRNWRSGLRYVNHDLEVKVIGALDDCLIDDVTYMPVDYKSKGKEPMDDGSKYYQTQLDIYSLMLEHNGFPTGDVGYLIYFWPKVINGGMLEIGNVSVINMEFGVKVFELKCSKERALDKITRAVEILRSQTPPGENPACEHCQYRINNEAKVIHE